MIGPVLTVTGLAARLIAGFGLREANTVDAVAHANYPILFVHGKADTFVPCEMSQQAYDACTNEKELIDQLRCRNGNLEIMLAMQESAPAEL